MTEKKSSLSSLRNQDRKKSRERSMKINKLLPNILTDKITELNELIQNLDRKFD